MAPSRIVTPILLGILIPVLAMAASLPDKQTGDSLNVTWMSVIDTPGGAMGIALSGSYAYVADDISGLHVINITDPSAPTEVGSVDTPGSAADVTLSGNLAYVADFDHGVRIIDVSNPAAPSSVGVFETSGYAYAVAVEGSSAYVADATDGLRIIDVSQPTAPYELGHLDTTGWAADIAVSGNTVYLADGVGGLRIIDVSNPAAPSEVGVFNQNSYMDTVTIVGNLAYVFDSWNGLLIIDVSNPTAPVQVGFYNPTAGVNDIAIADGYAYLASDIYGVGAGFQVVDISDPTTPVNAGFYFTGDHCYGVAVSGSYAYVAENQAGMLVLRHDPPTEVMTAVMTPLNPPVTIPAAGGDFFYDVSLQNITDQPLVADAVLEAVLPNGTIYPVLTKPGITFPAGATIVRNGLAQHVPAGAPVGSYLYRLNIVDATGAVLATDDFPFDKLAALGIAPLDETWTLKGWDDRQQTPDAVPGHCVLGDAFPNPFNPSTAIHFELARSQRVSLRIYDLRGQLVRTLVAGENLAPGSYTQTWLGDDDTGRAAAGGVYLYRLQTDDFSATKRMTMIK